jgi:protein-S-isoprenylcysteine O-methyltransferase Ste14
MKWLELKIPPLALLLLLGAAMWFVAINTPQLTIAIPGHGWLAVFLAALGIGIVVAGVSEFRSANTTLDPTNPDKASRVVSSGIFRRSRNPMYLGMLLALGGWAFYLSHAAAFLFLPAFIAYMNRFQIGPEENALCSTFGEEYRDYKHVVRRWI